MPRCPFGLIALIVRLVLVVVLPVSVWAWQSALVGRDASGRLTYTADASGNRIPDFSNAGYKGGGVPLPTVPVVRTLTHASGDQTARIQAALDEVAALPIQANGYRGALQLTAGTWEVQGTIRLRASGVVLAGVGDREDAATNTLLRRSGTSTAAVIQAGTRNDGFRTEIVNTRTNITTPRVTVGSRSFEVDRPELYRVGDAIIVWHPSTQAWLDAVDRGGVTDSNFWKPGEIDLRYHRYITAIAGNTLTLDAPVFNHLDRSLAQSVIYKYDAAHVIRNVGIEKLQVHIVTAGELRNDHCEDAITFVGTEDAWLRDATMRHFWHAGVQFEGSTRGTVERCRALDPHAPIDGGYRYNFSIYQSQQILMQDCFASNGRHAYVCNGTSLDAGIVFLNCVSDRALTSSEGHRRWGTGFLYDNLTATNRQSTDFLGLYNRGTYGTGHGWASAHSVAWNVNAAGGRIWIQRPPTAQNYAVGCSGNVTGTGPFAGPVGYIEGSNQGAGLEPRSLYQAQLAQRLAESAAPVLATSPAATHAQAGSTVALHAASLGAVAYQWRRDGTPIAGATQATLVLTSVTEGQTGNYTVTATNAAGTTTSAAAPLTLAEPTQAPGRLINLSLFTSITASANDASFSLGFVVGGSGGKPLLVRAMGPSLTPLGVGGVLSDPQLEFFAGGARVGANDNWGGDSALATAAAQVGAFPFTSATSRDAAVFNAGITTRDNSVKVSGVGSAIGTVLAEIYDGQAADALVSARLINVSVLKQIPAGTTLSVGFVLGGTTARTVLIRAIGPGLAALGLAGTLPDPKLALLGTGSTRIAENDNWAGEAQLTAAANAVGAFGLASNTSRDAVLLRTLAPGNYSVQVTSATTASGQALVEVYEVP